MFDVERTTVTRYYWGGRYHLLPSADHVRTFVFPRFNVWDMWNVWYRGFGDINFPFRLFDNCQKDLGPEENGNQRQFSKTKFVMNAIVEEGLKIGVITSRVNFDKTSIIVFK